MTHSDDESYRTMNTGYQQLRQEWKRKEGPCIVCGEREVNSNDHLPPRVLLPKSIRTLDPNFFTFPVCKQCNNSSSDEDFLFSVALSIYLNQDAVLTNQEPTDPDLLALYR